MGTTFLAESPQHAVSRIEELKRKELLSYMLSLPWENFLGTHLHSLEGHDLLALTDKVNTLLLEAKKVAKGSSISEAEIEPEWMHSYGKIARRCRDDREFGLSRYPYEPGPSVGAFTGGFFEHTEWPLRKGIEMHSSLRAVSEYEVHYINSAGYWMAFHEFAIDLRQEAIAANTKDEAQH